MTDRHDDEERYQHCQDLLFGQSFADAEAEAKRWLAEQPSSAHARYLVGLLARYNLEPVSTWREDFRAGFACGKRTPPPDPARYRTLADIGPDEAVFLFGDQGIGDQIRWSSHLPAVAERLGPRLSVCPSAKLVPLLSRNYPGLTILPQDSGAPFSGAGADAALLAMGDLDGSLWPDTGYEQRSGFLRADPDLSAKLGRRITAAHQGGGLRIGLCFRSMQQGPGRSLHYTTLADWEPILRSSRHSFFSLQYDGAEAELREAEQAFGTAIHRWPDVDLFDDIEAMAALMANLDLVISVTTMVADLASALGVPTWRLQTGSGAGSERPAVNPWYGPATHMYCKSLKTGWSPVMAAIATELDKRG